MKFKIADIAKAAERKPVGYYQDVMAHGKVDGEYLVLSVDNFKKLRLKYRGESVMGLPPIMTQAKTLSKAMVDFAGSGFKKVSREVFDKRMNECNKCEFWQKNALAGMGRCMKCGCSGAKQWMPTQQCPIGRWGKEA